MILYHYTTARGLAGILASLSLHASTAARNPKDVRYGNGQYLSDFEPGSKTANQLAKKFLNLPFAGSRYTHYVAINVDELEFVEGRLGVFVIPNDGPLDLTGRITGSGSLM